MEALALEALTATEMLSIGGAAVSAIGAIQQGNAAQAASNYNAARMEQNAAIEREQANQREEAKRRETRLLLGAQRAAFAQSGGGMGGSAADVMQQSAINAELDALTLRYEGEMRARGMESEAAAERFSNRQSQQSGLLTGAASVLSGISRYGESQENKRYREEVLRRMK